MSNSAFAGSPLLILPDLLLENGLITQSELDAKPSFSQYKTEFSKVIPFKAIKEAGNEVLFSNHIQLIFHYY